MAYNDCKISAVSRGDDGGVQSITLRFIDTGDATVPARTVEHTPVGGTKAQELLAAQKKRDETLLVLNNKKALAEADGLVVGLTIGPVPVVAPTAVEIAATAFGVKVVALDDSLALQARITARGITANGQFATDITALASLITTQRAAVNADYNAAPDAPTRTALRAKL